MSYLDWLLYKWRAKLARKWISEGSRILDIGCYRGDFLRSFGNLIGPSVGFDPQAPLFDTPSLTLVREKFELPAPLPDSCFDVIVMLATLEHIRDKEPVISECSRILRLGGRIVLTVPCPWVDRVIMLLRLLRFNVGISFDEHHGFDPREVPELFKRFGFSLEKWKPFQLGLNNLFVFKKTSNQGKTTPVSQLDRVRAERISSP